MTAYRGVARRAPNIPLRPEGSMAMTDSIPVTPDPVCGMTVDKATALHEERDEMPFSFCSEACRQQFLSAATAGNRRAGPDAIGEAAKA